MAQLEQLLAPARAGGRGRGLQMSECRRWPVGSGSWSA